MRPLNFLTIGFLIGAATCYASGLWVFLSNRRSAVSRSWFFLNLTAGSWSLSHFVMGITGDYQTALRFCYILYSCAVFIPYLYTYFIFALIRELKHRKKELRIILFASIVFLCALPSKWFISGVVPKSEFRYYDSLGPLSLVFLPFFAGAPLYALYRLIQAARRQIGLKVLQLQYVGFASVFGFLGGASTFLLAYNIPVPPFPVILFALYPLVIAYAIVRFRLMDITVVITRATIFLGVYAIVLGLPFVLSTSGKQWLTGMLGSHWWLGPLVLMATLGTLGPFVYLYLKNKAEAVILREQRALRQALENAAVDLTRIRNLDHLLDFVCATIARSGIKSCAIYFYDGKTRAFVLKAAINTPQKPAVRIDPLNSHLVAEIQRHKEPVILEEVKRKSEEYTTGSYQALESELSSLGAFMAVPCFLENILTEIIVLGEKKSGKLYLQDDVNNFLPLSREIALATENALLYGKIENEVQERTSELVETQKQLVQAEKLATVGTLAGGVAHEINNPLTAILTNVQMLLGSELKLDSDSKESLDMIEEATKRCRTIVQKLMTYAKKPMGPEEIKNVDLSAVVKGVETFLGYQMKQENIRLVIHSGPQKLFVKGNHNELEQVVTNIILNGKDAIKKGKKGGSIEITLSGTPEHAQIAIKDEGCGIPAEIFPKIFDPFFTTKAVGKGVGLGLSICQSIIEKHGGNISATSEVNKGTCFTIKLPRSHA
jgi:two-component system, NtrC family, sensor kinase